MIMMGKSIRQIWVKFDPDREKEIYALDWDTP